MNNQLVNRQTYTIAEAGKVVGIGRNSAYEATRTGQLPTIRIGGRLLVPRLALERMLNSTTVQSDH